MIKFLEKSGSAGKTSSSGLRPIPVNVVENLLLAMLFTYRRVMRSILCVSTYSHWLNGYKNVIFKILFSLDSEMVLHVVIFV